MGRRIVCFLGALLCAPSMLHAQDAAAEPPGRELVQKICGSCHSLTPVLMKRDGENGWRHTVGRMVLQRQAQILPDEFETIVRYLSTRLGPGTSLMTTGALPPGAFGGGAATADQVRLPDGPGKDAVQARCTLCHDLGRVVSFARKKEEWETLTRNMIGRGPQTSPAQVQAIIDYLTTHFLEKAE